MIKPETPINENDRISELKAYHVLDSLPEEDYDDLTSIAAEICGTSISLVSLIDENRQWFKSRYGLEASETPREYAFCAHAINKPDELFIVNDARKDERFHDNPLVTGDPNVTFYAGIPLVNDNGFSLGTLCVIDNKPKDLNDKQKKALKALGKQIMNILELRRKKMELESSIQSLEQMNEELDRFASTVAHDVKGPLVGINELVKLLDQDEYIDRESTHAKELVKIISNASGQLSHLVDRLLEYSKSTHLKDLAFTDVTSAKLKEAVLALFSAYDQLEINFDFSVNSIYTNQSAIERILLNLVNNAIKYNDKDIAEITISLMENDNSILLSVSDNGPGIPSEAQDKIFDVFKVLERDQGSAKGTGLGLAIVKRLVDSLNGSIKVESPEIGAKFAVSLPKES